MSPDMPHRVIIVSTDIARSWRCACPAELAIGKGDHGVIEADRVQEFVQVVELTQTPCDPAADGLPLLLRRATLQDQSRASENGLMARSATRKCHEKVRQLKLEMRLVLVRYAFDRSRLTVFFTADAYVDFRQLVQELASDLRCRIEMRQIGVRDAAGMIGGLAPCGRCLCCSVHLRDFDNINIRMAKMQGLSLNPSTINGMCGRLKCCLRYEQNAYAELDHGLPHEGAWVQCPAGRGKVVARALLRRRLKVQLEDQRVLDFDAEDVTMPSDRAPSRG
jgi:cell fate regulator YaaT (PSP1 superfamily)